MTTRLQPNDHRFVGNRYDRLRRAAELAADDPAVSAAPHPFDPIGLRDFVERITERRLLDTLSEKDADRVSLIVLVDFPEGPTALALRSRWLMTGAADYVSDPLAVARTLHLMIDALMHTSGDDREHSPNR